MSLRSIPSLNGILSRQACSAGCWNLYLHIDGRQRTSAVASSAREVAVASAFCSSATWVSARTWYVPAAWNANSVNVAAAGWRVAVAVSVAVGGGPVLLELAVACKVGVETLAHACASRRNKTDALWKKVWVTLIFPLLRMRNTTLYGAKGYFLNIGWVWRMEKCLKDKIFMSWHRGT
jgi:hypothetical protein